MSLKIVGGTLFGGSSPSRLGIAFYHKVGHTKIVLDNHDIEPPFIAKILDNIELKGLVEYLQAVLDYDDKKCKNNDTSSIFNFDTNNGYAYIDGMHYNIIDGKWVESKDKDFENVD